VKKFQNQFYEDTLTIFGIAGSRRLSRNFATWISTTSSNKHAFKGCIQVFKDYD